MIATMHDPSPTTFTDTCGRCGRVESFHSPDDPAAVDHWTRGPDGWLVVLVDWDGYLASYDNDKLEYGREFVVEHVCPECVTEEDQDAPHMSWRMESGAGIDGRGR